MVVCCAGSVVDWSADFGIDTPGVTVQWAFAFAVYSQFTSSPAGLDASPIETSTSAAGTPGNTQYNAYLLQVKAWLVVSPMLHLACVVSTNPLPAACC